MTLAGPASNKEGARVIYQVKTTFEGSIGVPRQVPRGEHGFGYDSVFIPSGDNRTVAELEPEEKNAVSHRFHAISLAAKEIKLMFDYKLIS